jgi:carbonic anhydrase
VTPAMSTLLVLSAVGNGGRKGLIMIIHHTDCGLCYATDAEISESLKGCVDDEAERAALDGMKFGSIGE